MRKGQTVRKHRRSNNKKSWSAGSKIPVKEVKLLRAEGRSSECGFWMTFKTLAEANKQLYHNSISAPEGGAYDKHDFIVTWEDGQEYKGRYDLHHNEYGNIGKQMKDWLTYLTNPNNTNSDAFSPKGKELDDIKKFLAKYSFE